MTRATYTGMADALGIPNPYPRKVLRTRGLPLNFRGDPRKLVETYTGKSPHVRLLLGCADLLAERGLLPEREPCDEAPKEERIKLLEANGWLCTTVPAVGGAAVEHWTAMGGPTDVLVTRNNYRKGRMKLAFWDRLAWNWCRPLHDAPYLLRLPSGTWCNGTIDCVGFRGDDQADWPIYQALMNHGEPT